MLDTIWKTVVAQSKVGLENYSVIITSYGYRNMPEQIMQTFESAVLSGFEGTGVSFGF
jgi:hypothetical protein